jgi:hypothetical protein
MIFEAQGGLSNRLRAVFSRFQPGTTISVVWKRYWDAADGHFLDAFEPIDGLTFVDDNTVAEASGWWAADGHDTWHKHYKLLRPVASLQARIDQVKESLGRYHAMHIRRTDLVSHCRSQGLTETQDSEFIRWAQEEALDAPIFLATDNTETRQNMLSSLGLRLVYQGLMQHSYAGNTGPYRYSTIGDAVVDMFVCVGASKFMGTAHSSFTDIIQHMRAIR